ncbi:hypothetical protein LZ198_26560 [Myxococcus sp. K15C18031901]|uniref:hypothetical protein n=1 Tax=Myxococcus dinghuensis TaxID=2906761 RepID=UPI0020A74F97|nr:hypothetical protein [Myxococcus dinghuensis]MCP3102440.1 hypothetical protein [Myxococcus dinghuensis]
MTLSKSAVSSMLLLGTLSLFTGCGEEPRPTQVIPAHESGALALLIERDGGEGLFVEGASERFTVRAAGEVLTSVRWSATGGAVTPDAERVTWTLPSEGRASLSVAVETASGKKAEGEFHFNVVAPANLVASTVIDPSPDVTGGFCELTFDSLGNGHVVYFNETHRSLWYGQWNGTSWTTEQIDGPGFNNDGQFTYNPVIAVEPATGTPHVAYLKGDGVLGSGATLRVAYATRAGGTWIRESVDPANRNESVRLSIALNPSQGLKPTIVYSDASSGLRVATRTGSNAWSIPQITTGGLTSEAVFDTAGTLYVVNKGSTLNAIKGSTVETFALGGLSSITGWFSLALTPGQHLLALPNGSAYNGAWVGFYDVTLGSPLSTSTTRMSQGDYVNHSNDLAYGGGKPYFAQRHGTTLELVTPDARGFWTFTQWGTIQDGTRPSIAIRPTDGTPHVCYQRDGKVTFQ